MSDSLKDRLTKHSHAFESLLSLIPARYYYDEETSNQWKKKFTRKSDEDKEESKRNRKDKFDPSKGSTALDELKRREQLADESSGEDAMKNSENVTIYDDNGNPVNDDGELSVQELLKLKSIEKLKPGEFQLESSSGDPSAEFSKPKPSVKKQPHSTSSRVNSSSSHQLEEDGSPGVDGLSESENTETENANQSHEKPLQRPINFPSEKLPKSDKPKPGIEALRAKLAAKVDELRAKRKAPGTSGPGVPKNRAELLAARKLKLEQKKKLSKSTTDSAEKETNKDASDSEEEEDADVEAANDDSTTSLDMNLSFGQVRFKDGDKLSKDGSGIEQQRKLKKRNAIDQLKVLENKKAKISKLDSEKQNEIAENAKWSRAILQSEGAKVRDDEKLLKKTIKQNENRKKRSEKEWNRRIYQTKKGISDREAKRDANISAHREAKKLRLKGKKRKDHMKKASNNFKAR